MVNNIGPAGLLLLLFLIGYFGLAFLKSWKGRVYLKNPHNGKIREAPLGFSWTTFFFGFFPALFRSHWSGAIIMLLAHIVTAGISSLILAFFYNKWYLKSLIKDGYLVVKTDKDAETIQNYLGYELPLLPKD